MRLAWWNLAATLTALSLVSTAAAQHAGTGARFHDPAQISGDPTGLRHANHLGPKYPDRARAAEQTAAPVVAFVVDTSGRVEVPTASFLDDTGAEFRAVVCEMLRNCDSSHSSSLGRGRAYCCCSSTHSTRW